MIKVDAIPQKLMAIRDSDFVSEAPDSTAWEIMGSGSPSIFLMMAYPATARVAVTPTEAAAFPAAMIPAGMAASMAGIVP